MRGACKDIIEELRDAVVEVDNTPRWEDDREFTDGWGHDESCLDRVWRRHRESEDSETR